MSSKPQALLRHHVTGAIERGEATAIEEKKPDRCYKTFKRSCTSWPSFASARKTTVDRNLTEEEARRACDRYNSTRTPAQVRKGTKLEYTRQ